MTATINLGKVSIDAVAYGVAASAILGIKESGKSYTATYIAEHLFDAGIPFVAFDPIGIWRYMRVPGKGRGYQVVVAGGAEPDWPLTVATAPEIVRAAMKEGISLVLDLFDMKLSKGDWRKIVMECVRVLLHENRQHGMRHVFLEEAAEFVPQMVGRDLGQVYAEVEKMVRMGGNARLGCTLINPRAQEINKAVLELCENLFLHRQRGKNALQNMDKWLAVAGASEAKEIVASLPELPQGSCWAWIGGDKPRPPTLIRVPHKSSFHPDRRVLRGEEAATRRRPPVDVGAFVERMRGSLANIEAQAKANDVPTLRAQIAKLEAQLTGQGKAPAVNAEAIEQARQAGYALAEKELAAASTRAAKAQVAATLQAVEKALDPLYSALAAAKAAVQTALREAAAVKPVVTIPAYTAAPALAQSGSAAAAAGERPPAPAAVSGITPNDGDRKLGRAKRRILTALAQYPQGRAKNQVAVLTGYAVNGGGFGNALSALRTAGYLTGHGEHLEITEAGLAALGPYDPLPTGHELLEHWLGQLSKAERESLRVLAEAYPDALPKDEVAAKAGYEPNGGGFGNAISRLRTLELVTGRGELRASDHLFG